MTVMAQRKGSLFIRPPCSQVPNVIRFALLCYISRKWDS